jgi:hypothetical protein
MASCGMRYIPSFMLIGSDIQKLFVGDTQTVRWSYKHAFVFSKEGI